MSILATEAPQPITLAGTTSEPQRLVNVAVVGLGRAGLLHAAVLSAVPNCSLIGAVDARHDARREFRGLGFSAPLFDRLDKMLRKAKPEAVWVCLPHGQRDTVARQVLEMGGAVLIDGPLARTATAAAELVRLAQEKEVPLASGHPLVHQPVFARVQSILASGMLGRLAQVRLSRYVSRVFSPWQQRALTPKQPVGGVVAQQASDLLVLLAGTFGTPVEVRATTHHLYGKLEDEIHAMMELASGVEVGFDASWSTPGYARPSTVVEIDGENGKLLASDDAIEVELFEPGLGLAEGVTRFGPSDLPHEARFDLDGEALYLQDSSFLAWLTGAPAPPNRAAVAVEAVKVMEALYASAREGGKPVSLPT